MKKELSYKQISGKLEEKTENEEGVLHIKFYGLAFNNVDSYGDVIEPKAVDAFLASADRERLKLCYQHDRNQVIGVITSAVADDYGLLCEADVLPTTTGKDVQLLIKAGAINEFSIGYYADKYRFEKRAGYDYELRILEEITLVEISPVTRAANAKAILLDAKAENTAADLKTLSDAELMQLKESVDQEANKRFLNYLDI